MFRVKEGGENVVSRRKEENEAGGSERDCVAV